MKLISKFGTGHDTRVDALPIFNGDEILHIFDIFDDRYISRMIDSRGRPRAILSDHVIYCDPNLTESIEFYCLPLWAMRECRQWTQADFDPDPDLVSHHVFNFMINRKQCSRFLLMRLVEIGGYTNFDYTWSGLGRNFDLASVIEEMNTIANDDPMFENNFRSRILAPIELPTRFLTADILLDHDTEQLATVYGRIHYGGNKLTWQNFLAQMFTTSCVSLISESGGHHKIAVITEKTLYAFFGLTFPIWVGNYAQARAVEQIGFDVFTDVINHDYQWYPTLIERCYWAFELNQKILRDFNHASGLRQKHRKRLLANRQFLLEDGLGQYCVREIDKVQTDYKESFAWVKHLFDTTRSNMTED